MSREQASDVFARRSDPEWEMFCRGRREDVTSLAGPEQRDREPVDLAPGDGPAGDPSASGAAAVRHFYAKVVGVTYPNEDGTSRRDAVRVLGRWEVVRLVHRPDNPVDVNAVAVLNRDGRQLGYLPATLAKDVVAAARGTGTRYLALVSDVTGGGPESELLLGSQPVGARLLILALEGGATKDAARRYFRDLMNRK